MNELSKQTQPEQCKNETGDYYMDFTCELLKGHRGDHSATYTWNQVCISEPHQGFKCYLADGHEGRHRGSIGNPWMPQVIQTMVWD